jgi:hypothetical protein
LDLSFNFIEDISVFATEFSKTIRTILPNTLTKLALNDNKIKKIDGLQHLHLINPNLNTLLLQNNKLKSIDKMSRLPDKLEYLNLYGNELDENLVPLCKPNVLKYLSLGRNNITDISKLYMPETLQYLYLENNRIEDISKLAKLPPNLSYLYLEHNLFVDISPFGFLPRSLCIFTFSSYGVKADTVLNLVDNNRHLKYIAHIKEFVYSPRAIDKDVDVDPIYDDINKTLIERRKNISYVSNPRKNMVPFIPRIPPKRNRDVTPKGQSTYENDESIYKFTPENESIYLIEIKKKIIKEEFQVWVLKMNYDYDIENISNAEVDELNRQQYLLFDNLSRTMPDNYWSLIPKIDSFASLYLKILLNKNYPKSKLNPISKPRTSQLLSFAWGEKKYDDSDKYEIKQQAMIAHYADIMIYVSKLLTNVEFSYYIIQTSVFDLREERQEEGFDKKTEYNVYVYENDYEYPKGSTSVMKKEIDDYNEQQYILFEYFREIEANYVASFGKFRYSPQYTEDLSEYIEMDITPIPIWLENLIHSFTELYVRMVIKSNFIKCPLVIKKVEDEEYKNIVGYWKDGSNVTSNMGYKYVVSNLFKITNLRYFIVSLIKDGDSETYLNIHVYENDFGYENHLGVSLQTDEEREEVDKLNILQYKLFNLLVLLKKGKKVGIIPRKYMTKAIESHVIQTVKVLQNKSYNDVVNFFKYL